MEQQQYIIFFDGVCNLCNGFIDFVARKDTKNQVLFASLQGKNAKKLLPEKMSARIESIVVLLPDGGMELRSAAFLRIMRVLGHPYALLSVFFLVPGFIRDFIYDFIATNRYRLFGKRESCRMPSPDERAKFLE